MKTETVTTYTQEMDHLAAQSRNATFYHSRAWVESLAETYPRMTFRCLLARQAGSLCGFFPYFVLRRGPLLTAWSMPFGAYGGPVASDDRCAAELRRAYASVLTTTGAINASWIDFYGTESLTGWESRTVSTHLIDLSRGFASLLTDTIEKQRKKRSRRARRLGVSVRRGDDGDDLKRFYEIYRDRLENWGETTHHPLTLFAALLERGGDSVRLYVAEHDGGIVGGHFNFYWKKTVTAWQGFTMPESNPFQPATLLYIECMKSASEEGFDTYNLGESLGKESLIAFKESLGGVPYAYRIFGRRSLLGKLAPFIRGARELRRAR
jgi:CelD/BcsL family acetyltransferase involved in cellulose biosynthesis